MHCEKCSSKIVINNLCKEHFLEYFEEKVKKTIEDFNLLEKNDDVCVAVSGGKDSVVLLYLLKKFGYKVSGLAIDEGIRGYRGKTLDFLKEFCEKHEVSLVIKSFKDETGKELDDMIQDDSPRCNACGTFRRFILNKYSQGFDKIATGHNLDDESQAVMMNLMKAQTELFDRQGPITKDVEGFTQKVKPLYLMKEKEILAYAFLKGFNVPFGECPYARLSFRSKIRDYVNSEESKNPGTKERIIKRFLKLKTNDNETVKTGKCEECGFPSENKICKACRLKKEINN
jgi:tRNA-5-methyluridine54 2-sulfurtransferase